MQLLARRTKMIRTLSRWKGWVFRTGGKTLKVYYEKKA